MSKVEPEVVNESDSGYLFNRAVTQLMIRWRWALLAIAAMIAVGSFFLSKQLDFDRSIESMFADDDPVLEPYRELKKRFVGNELVLAVYNDPNLLNPDGTGIENLSKVAAELRNVEGVKDILSLSEVNEALKSVYALARLINRDQSEFPVVDPENDLAKEFLDIFEGYTHSPDGKTVSIVCLLDPKTAEASSRRQTILELREIIGKQLIGKLTGEPVLVSDGFEFVEQDGRRLGRTSIALLALVIIACFRSIRWVLIPIAVVYWSLWVAKSIIVMLGLQMSMVSSMLTAIITVIGVATVIHLIVRYREARSDGRSQEASIEHAFRLLIAPIFWACVTDAAGFSSLLFAETGPVRDFGLMMSIASLCVLVGIVMIVPGLSLLGSFDSIPKRVWGESNLRSALTASTGIMRRSRKLIAVAIALAFVVVSCGIFFLQVETDFTKNFKPGTEIADAYEFVEHRMGGAGIIDVIVPAPKTLSMEYLEKIERLEDELRLIKRENSDELALKKVVSLADLDRVARSLRVLKLISPELRYQGMARVMPTFAAVMRYTADDKQEQDYFRVMLRTSQRGSAQEQQALIDHVQQITSKHFTAEGPTESRPQTTGIFVLLANLVTSLLDDQIKTFAIANLFIFLVMLLALRSIRLAIIAMVPNVVPILMLMGTLGWFGLKLNMGAVMIAAVSIGLSIDSSIHYLWAYQRWRNRGLNVFEAIQQSQHRVGRAAMYSTIALVAGFSTLCISQFIPTIYFGALVSLSMLGGLFGNLVVLPIILLLTEKRKSTNEIQTAATS